MKHRKLKAKLLALTLSVTMVCTMLPAPQIAMGENIPIMDQEGIIVEDTQEFTDKNVPPSDQLEESETETTVLTPPKEETGAEDMVEEDLAEIPALLKTMARSTLEHNIGRGSLTINDNDGCSSGSPHIITGTTGSSQISVRSGTHHIMLSNVNISMSSSSSYTAFEVGAFADVHLILGDDTTNTLKGGKSFPGVQVKPSAKLTISGNGTLIAEGQGAAGIGILNDRYGSDGVGNIIIDSGTITAKGGSNGAGIGGFNGSGQGSINISINGGNITATGGDNCAGIGSNEKGNISISGGTINAISIAPNAGIGNNDGGDINITGGDITAMGGKGSSPISRAGVGIFARKNTNTQKGGNINISGGTITARSGDAIRAAVITDGGTLNIVGMMIKYKVGDGYTGATHIADNKIYQGSTEETEAGDVQMTVLDSESFTHDISTASVTLESGDYCTETMPHVISGDTKANTISVAGGKHFVTLDGVKIDVSGTDGAAFGLAGDADIQLTLANGTTNTLTSGKDKAGLQAPAGTTIAIDGQGSLEATGGSGGAGIGGGNSGAGGIITIGGGTVTAIGGASGTGIGGGDNGAGGTTSITGGTVTATGGASGAGIGGKTCGIISITDGIVTAKGGIGIGGSGTESDAESKITIIGGTVTASGNGTGAAVRCSSENLVYAGMAIKYKDGTDYAGATNIANGKIYEGDTQAKEARDVKISKIGGALGHEISTGSLTITGVDQCSAQSPHMISGKTEANTIRVTGGTHFVTLNGVNIDVSGIDGVAFGLTGDADIQLTLADGTTNTLKSYAYSEGLQVPAGTAIAINGKGTLTAVGSIGIGSDNDNDPCGAITITDGMVTAQGNWIGIGSKKSELGSKITITGGTVMASAQEYNGAAVRCGEENNNYLNFGDMEIKYKMDDGEYTGPTFINLGRIYAGTTDYGQNKGVAKDVKISKSLIDYTGTQAAAPDATPTAKTHDSITLASVVVTGETVEYAYSTSTTAPTEDSKWQTDPTITKLTANTQYYFFARVKANNLHKAGTASAGTAITTDKNSKLEAAQGAVAKILNAFAATNETTAEAILTAVQGGIKDTKITAAWDEANPFTQVKATEQEKGSIKGKITLSDDSEKLTVDVDLIIALVGNEAEEAVNQGKNKVDTALKGFTVTNTTSEAAINALINDVLAGTGITSSWKVPFKKVPATTEAPGSITGTITLSLENSKKSRSAAERAITDIAINLTIAKLSGDDSSSSSGSGGSSDSSDSTTPSTPTGSTPGGVSAPTVVDQNGNVSAVVSDKNISDAIALAKQEALKNDTATKEVTAVIHVPAPTGSNPNTVAVSLSNQVLQQMISSKVDNVAIVIDNQGIAIDITAAALKEMSQQSDADIQLSVARTDVTTLSAEAQSAIGSRPVFNFNITGENGSQTISNFGDGLVKVAIPYTLQAGEMADGVQAVYVDDSGKVSKMVNSVYDTEQNMLRFATNHFSIYGITYKTPVEFVDVADHWAKKDIAFVVKRGVMGGTDSATFAPDEPMTRGMFVTALGRLAKVETAQYQSSPFTDVPAEAYYAPYVNWAANKGITGGLSADTFGPEQMVTRQEMAVFMARYAKAMGYELPQKRAAETFADNSTISSQAAEAVLQMQMAGVLGGRENKQFDPDGSTTRGETAAVLHRYINILAL